MKSPIASRILVLATLLLAIAASAPANAQVNINISIAPPAMPYEQAPALAPGYVWAPGYWAWHGDRYIWVRGRSVVQRIGYRWEPDRWEQRDRVYYRQPGRWEPDREYRANKVKKDKSWKNERDDGEHGKRKNKNKNKGEKDDD